VGAAFMFARAMPAIGIATRPLYIELGLIPPDPEQP
jgi:hypothetical protein